MLGRFQECQHSNVLPPACPLLLAGCSCRPALRGCPPLPFSRCPRFFTQRHGIGHQVIDTPHGTRTPSGPHVISTERPPPASSRTDPASAADNCSLIGQHGILSSLSNYPLAPRVGRVLPAFHASFAHVHSPPTRSPAVSPHTLHTQLPSHQQSTTRDATAAVGVTDRRPRRSPPA
jgi:hypothetical protein